MAAEAADAFWRSVAILRSSISTENWSEKDEDERN